LRDIPLEYEIYPIVQQIIYDDMLIHITRLYLNDCRLTRLPDAVQELQFIQVLCLDANYFRNIPHQVTSLQFVASSPSRSFSTLFSYLSVFYMNDNNLSSLKTSTLRKCPSLKSLWLEKNNLKSIPGDIHRLESLTYLHLGQNRIESISPQIKKCSELRGLWLYNNQLDSLPIEVTFLPRLSILDLENNEITFLPRTIRYVNL
jgi:leucine-rich repeat protein SHOC2